MTREQRKPVLAGGCQCGGVRYVLYALPEDVYVCHCRMCQKAVGGPFAGLVPVRRSDFAWTRGTPESFRSSSLAERYFCRNCGTPLTFRYLDSDWISATVGSLDRPDDVLPVAQYGIESRVGWLDRLPMLPVRSMAGKRTQKRVVFQHPDHDTPSGWQPPRLKTANRGW